MAEQAGQGSFKRRDALLSYEEQVKKLWEKQNPNEIDAKPEDSAETFYVTFPFPYMNGRLHLGHAFSLTKAEFTARYQRLVGKRVLWPFAFHCTGMPIAACADKLKNELEDAASGGASKVDVCEEEVEVELKNTATFGGKKSKALAKTGPGKTQFEILQGLGVSDEDIPKFADAAHWLDYFPPIGRSDLERFGLSVDWRRAFITTDVNPYFDRFVRWQYRLLKERGHVKFGLRPAVFSRIDNQPCADHDRAAGEGANPQEYTMLKMTVVDPPTWWLEKCPQLKGARIHLVAATLRPETMYAQTNCFVLPSGTYHIVPAFAKQLAMEEIVADQKGYVAVKTMTNEEVCQSIKDYYICSARSAANMAYQGIVPVAAATGKDKYPQAHCAMQITGHELLGTKLHAPLTVHSEIYVLPLPSIKMDKGTGIVTSVPSDSPDDYAMMKDLQTKVKLREEYGVQEEWTAKEIVEVIEIPGLGRRAAVELCEARKVSSYKDELKLKEIKKELYLKGFYEGIMIVGKYAGKPVREAKDLVKADLIASGDALAYLEPEKKVISRSGDDCVVALCNQWYSDFGNPEWKTMVKKHVEDPNAFDAHGQRQAYIAAVDWLEGWACSRNYGLGTLLPWEAEQGNRVLIESLSDSTIYFAYYTVCHYWQGDMYGKTPGLMNVKAEDLGDAEFNYVFCQTDTLPLQSNVHEDKLKTMRSAFEYWYPMNLRVSGKDLVTNHLIMSLFHHAAIWPQRPDLWPRGYYVNGHLLLDSEKMSKSTGNFLTLNDAVLQYTADATRLALADAGDSIDDANFERAGANACLMKLYILVQFVEEITRKRDQGVLYKGPKRWADRMFENECVDRIIKAKNAFDQMIMRDALKFGFYELNSLKDTYRTLLSPEEELHQDSITQWIDWITVVASPMAPFIMEFIHSVLLKKSTLVVNEPWPTVDDRFDGSLHRRYQLLIDFAEDQRKALEKAAAPAKKAGAVERLKPTKMTVYVAADYLPWQQDVLRILQTVEIDTATNTPKDLRYIDLVKNADAVKALDGKTMKLALGFASYQMRDELKIRGPAALSLQLGFDEAEWIAENREYLLRTIGLQQMEVVGGWTEALLDQTKKAATPGKPIVLFS